MSLKRIQKDLDQLKDDPLLNCIAKPLNDDDMYHLRALIVGPEDSPYEGGVFHLNMHFTQDYPLHPPEVCFMTPIYHCNIGLDGSVCMDILGNNWSPALSIGAILLSIRSLLTDPNPYGAMNGPAARLYTEDRIRHDRIVQKWTRKYASSEHNDAEVPQEWTRNLHASHEKDNDSKMPFDHKKKFVSRTESSQKLRKIRSKLEKASSSVKMTMEHKRKLVSPIQPNKKTRVPHNKTVIKQQRLQRFELGNAINGAEFPKDGGFYAQKPPAKKIEATTVASRARIQKELAELRRDPIPNCTVFPKGMYCWRASILGPCDSPYKGGIFVLNITFPLDYPLMPPKVCFETPIYHCNISSSQQVDFWWNPDWTFGSVLLFICSLLMEPNLDQPAMPDIARLFQTDRALHDAMAREWTMQYATSKGVVNDP